METAADTLEKLGSLDQAISESDSRLESLRLSVANLTEERASLLAAVEEVKAESDAIRAAANAEADEIIKTAVAKACAEVEGVRAKAKETLDSDQAEAADKLQAIKDEFDNTNGALRVLVAKRAELDAEIVERTSAVEKLEERVGKVKAQLEKMLG
jgi:chromosome segregation ATPase